MRVADALALIRGRLPVSAGVERVVLGDAPGRVLAQDVVAPLSLPPFDNSAVDGYAFRFDDRMSGPLPVAARVPAGAPVPAIPPGSVVRIFTGAPLPPGADTVAMQEDVRVEGGAVRLPEGLARGANCRRAGEDVRTGSSPSRLDAVSEPATSPWPPPSACANSPYGIACGLGCSRRATR